MISSSPAVGINALQYTEVWLKRNYEKLEKISNNCAGSSGSAIGTPTPANVMTEAFLEVIEWEHPNNFPEV